MSSIGIILSVIVIIDGLVASSLGHPQKVLSIDYDTKTPGRGFIETFFLNINSQNLRRIPHQQLRPCPSCIGLYSYCSEFLFHDACCCSDPKHISWACKSVDCRFLNAINCEQHFMITDCCCSDRGS